MMSMAKRKTEENIAYPEMCNVWQQLVGPNRPHFLCVVDI